MCTRLNKTAASNTSESLQLLDYFLLYFQTILPVTVQEPNCYMQQEIQARNKPDIPDSQQISMKGLYEFLAITNYGGPLTNSTASLSIPVRCHMIIFLRF
jgi:hypothetical protein